MDALEQARAEIDEVDAQLAALFERRMAAVLQVAEYKRAHGLPIFDAAREAAVLEKAAANMTADIPDCMIAEEVDRQMERFGYQLQMNGMSLKQYSEMMGGNLDALRDSMKGMAEAKVKQMVLLDAVAEAEKVEVTADDIAEEYKKLADAEPDVIFGGRLGEYKYYDMDKVIESALACVAVQMDKINQYKA